MGFREPSPPQIKPPEKEKKNTTVLCEEREQSSAKGGRYVDIRYSDQAPWKLAGNSMMYQQPLFKRQEPRGPNVPVLLLPGGRP